LKKILYIQYANPGAYPPLEHSSKIFANLGWRVVFLGTGSLHGNNLKIPPHPNIRIIRWPWMLGGWVQKMHYLCFGIHALILTCFLRPGYIYASDPLICPIALVIKKITNIKVLYHEHDSPPEKNSKKVIEKRGKQEDEIGLFQSVVLEARERLAREVDLCVLPNEERARMFREQTKTMKTVECVWNVPRCEEIGTEKAKPDFNRPLAFFYGGSLSSERLPATLLDEIAKKHHQINFHIVGYQTYSHSELFRRILEMSKSGLIHYHGALPRKEMWKIVDLCDAALCLMPMTRGDINMKMMIGASNKPFDALARGLALVVSDLPQWKRLYLPGELRNYEKSCWISDTGYGIAINPVSRKSITAGLEWMLSNREKLWEMGERGRQKIQEDWNYERAFDRIRATIIQ